MTTGSWILQVAVFILAMFAFVATLDWSPEGIERRKEITRDTFRFIIIACLIIGGIWAIIDMNS